MQMDEIRAIPRQRAPARVCGRGAAIPAAGGTGNIVHNLALVDFGRPDGEPWAERFKEEVKVRILARDHPRLIDFASLTPEARLAVPSPRPSWPRSP
jgi:aromatic ring-opening dioxygenase catalytic subunit (LigB family)